MNKIVLTGATGYIGSNLVRRLLNENKEVFIIVRENSKFDLLYDIKDKVSIFIYDNKIINLINFFKKIKPCVVYHLASLVIVDHEHSDIDNLIDSNIKFGAELLEAMSQAGVKKLINTGTSWQHFNNEKYNPVCLYAATKEAFEKIIEYYTIVCGFRAITLELFDTYGPKDNRKKIINLLDKCSREKTVLKMSGGEQFLDLTYIDDVTSGFYSVLNNLNSMKSYTYEKYAISANNRYKLKDVIELYEEVTTHEISVEWGARPYRNREIMYPSTSTNLLPGWRPEITLKEGLILMNKINYLKEECGTK